MKRALPVVLILAHVAVAAQERGSQRLAAIPLQFPDGTRLSVEVARTPQQQQIGMMFRRRVPLNTGMLFVFDQSGPQTFWMKNTLVSLDLIFISADRRITSIAAAVPPTRVDTPEQDIPRRSGVGKYVLEVAAGFAAQHRLKPGDRLRFNESISSGK